MNKIGRLIAIFVVVVAFLFLSYTAFLKLVLIFQVLIDFLKGFFLQKNMNKDGCKFVYA